MLTSFKTLPRIGAVAVAASLLFGATIASAQRIENAPELSEKVSSGIAPLAAMYEAKKWDDAIKTIDGLLAKADPSSYDRAFLSGYKAQLVFTKGDAAAAIEPLETMLKIADEKGLFRWARVLPINENETLSTLSQLYMAEAAVPGKTKEAQQAAMAKAHAYGKRMVSGPKVTAEAQYMWARILYSEATFGSEVDLNRMKETAQEAGKVLRLTITPKDEHYTLYLAALQHLGDNAACSELLELMVKKFPNNKSFWPMLFQTYLALQASNDKEAELGAVVTLERAQAVGQMVSNRDNYQLAGLYYNMQQHQYAAELLENGLRNGKIDSEQRNWELLANCYQQMGKEARAIEVFLEAIKIFPKAGNLEQLIAQIYYNSDKPEQALKHFQAAVNKGLDKPAPTLVLVSYLALELKRLDEALVAAEQAVKADPKSKEAVSLLKLIKESIDEREKFKGTATAQPKK